MAHVTIITDASHCPNTQAGGYGVWVAGPHGKQAFGGPLSGTQDSSEIEAKAICNGLYHGIKSGLIHHGDTVLLQSDCQGALHLLELKRVPREREFDILDWITDTAMKNNLQLKYRHVKGHTQKQDSRSKAQDHCDKLAGQYMASERKRIQNAFKAGEMQVEVIHQRTKPRQQPQEDYWEAQKGRLRAMATKALG